MLNTWKHFEVEVIKLCVKVSRRIHVKHFCSIKMNSFHVIQTQFDVLEIRQLHQPQKFALNWKNVAILFFISIQLITVFLFLVTEASTYDEYFGSIFISLTASTTFFSYLEFAWQRNSIFKLITDLNRFVTKREIHLTAVNYICISKSRILKSHLF